MVFLFFKGEREMILKEGDLFEIVFNSHFKVKGYLINYEQYSQDFFKIRLRGFIDNKENTYVIKNNTYIRYIGKVENHIYIITNILNGKQYIGRTCNSIEKRFKHHFTESKQLYSQTALHKDMQLYGKQAFKIEKIYSFYADRQKDANKVEQEFIKKYNTKIPNGYNMA